MSNDDPNSIFAVMFNVNPRAHRPSRTSARLAAQNLSDFPARENACEAADSAQHKTSHNLETETVAEEPEAVASQKRANENEEFSHNYSGQHRLNRTKIELIPLQRPPNARTSDIASGLHTPGGWATKAARCSATTSRGMRRSAR